MSEGPGPGEHWTCGTCGKAVLGVGSWGISPEAICHCCVHDRRSLRPQMMQPYGVTKKKEGKFICKCECGGQVRGVEEFGRLWTWCEKCSPLNRP